MSKNETLDKLKQDISSFKTLDKEFYKDKDICYYALTQDTKLVKYVVYFCSNKRKKHNIF